MQKPLTGSGLYFDHRVAEPALTASGRVKCARFRMLVETQEPGGIRM